MGYIVYLGDVTGEVTGELAGDAFGEGTGRFNDLRFAICLIIAYKRGHALITQCPSLARCRIHSHTKQVVYTHQNVNWGVVGLERLLHVLLTHSDLNIAILLLCWQWSAGLEDPGVLSNLSNCDPLLLVFV